MNQYLLPLNHLFAANANAQNALAMKAYMKNRFEFFGIRSTQRRELQQAFLAEENDLQLIEQLILTKSWWDTVDGLASWVCGPYFLKFPEKKRPITDAWAISENMWLRRTSIIFQLGYKRKNDTELLFKHIELNLGTKEFFINKAIGWSLREYAKTDAGLVSDYVKQMEKKLHPLSVREALKNL